MSIPLGLPGLDRPTFRSRHLDQVRAELAPLLDRIATGTLQRELDGELQLRHPAGDGVRTAER